MYKNLTIGGVNVTTASRNLLLERGPVPFDPVNSLGDMAMKRNTAITISFQITDSAGLPVTTGTATALITLDGVQSASTNIAAHLGNGQWAILLTAAETNGLSVTVLVTHPSAVSPISLVFTTQNDISVANILAGVVDGTVDVETALKRILSVIVNDSTGTIGTDPTTLAYKDSAGSATVVSMSVPDSGSGRTTTV